MKKNILAVLVVSAIALGVSFSALAQKPPQPPEKGQIGDQPVGGSAPIGGGIEMLLLLGAGYGAKRIFDARKKLAE